MAATRHPFILCADDYALCASVDAGILRLLRQQQLSAVSCLVESPRWPEAAAALRAYVGRVDIGLHINFTQAFPGLPAWRLPALLVQAWLHRLPEAAVEARIAQQLERFQQHFGSLPDFIDGHQHVHQLPQLRDALLRQIPRHWPQTRPWVRVPWPRRYRGAKAAVIGLLGARALQRRLTAAGIASNPDFAGVYSLAPDLDYRRRMQAWLADLAPGGLIMCHPGALSDGAEDPLATTRWHELAYLGSATFAADCHAAGRELARFAVPPRSD